MIVRKITKDEAEKPQTNVKPISHLYFKNQGICTAVNMGKFFFHTR